MAADPITADAAAELLNYDLSDDDPFNDNPQTKSRDDKAVLSPRSTKRKAPGDNNDNSLGLDEEVKITKKRKPTVKLDEARLLTAPGIPKLREIARSSMGVTRKLRMKGKGHEFSDVAKLLNFYQLWLDGLFPRAKFADGLQLIEKAGHSKRMNVMRKEWIDEGKPGYIKPGTELVESILNDEFPMVEHAGHNGQPTRTLTVNERPVDDGAGMFFPSPSKKISEQMIGTLDPDDDELDALLAMQGNRAGGLAPTNHVNDIDEDDDLDALLAEQESRQPPTAHTTRRPEPEEDYEDDLDAFLAEQDTRAVSDRTEQAAQIVQPTSSSRPSSSHSGTKPRKRAVFDDTDSEGEDDLDALLAEQDARQHKSTPPTSPSHSEEHGPTLPDLPKDTATGNNDESQDGVAKVFSSSPIRNSSQKDGLATKPYSSSPLPNNPEEEDDLDALLAESGM